MFPNLRSEVILGTPWLIKEYPDIDWVKPKVKMRHQGQIYYCHYGETERAMMRQMWTVKERKAHGSICVAPRHSNDT